MRLKEIFLGVFVIFIIVCFIIPLPTWLMDILLMVNITIGLLILLNALYAKESLEMSLFPTLLLITTLYRLALNISSTRLILSNANAGEVVRTFGSFVAGGNIIIGIIIFLIIVIVNLMVVTNGSSRVSEVSARFTLDAMPGKQMAIDADLNAGIIDEHEAINRRQKIQDEAQFYGSMDGALKFVKGDAIAGIIVTVINIVGGIALGSTGLSNAGQMTFMDALNTYTVLTIGDGLVSQIPAILISTATGLIVTKAAGATDVSSDVINQLFSFPKILLLTGLTMAALGIVTPLPITIFVPAGLALIFVSRRISDKQEKESIKEEITSSDEEVDEIRRPENVMGLLQVDPIELEFGYGIIPLADVNQGGDLLDRVVMIRRQIALELGTVVPIIRLRDNIQLSPNQYIIKIKGVEIAGGEILFDHYLAMNPGYVEAEIDGIETIEPSFGLPALWISDSQRERAEALGYTVVDPPSIIATQLTEVIKANLHDLLNRQDVQNLINNVKEANSALVDELTPKYLSVGEIQKVLSNLLREGISIRDMVTIMETLADYAPVTRDSDMLTEYVRQSLRRAISKKYFTDENNSVITLDPDLEQQIMKSVQQTEQGSYLALDPQTTQQIFDKVNIEINKLISRGQQPIILTSPIVRTYFKKLIEQIVPDLVVLSYNELDPKSDIQSVGMVSLA